MEEVKELKDYANKFNIINEKIDNLKKLSSKNGFFNGVSPSSFGIIENCRLAFLFNIVFFCLFASTPFLYFFELISTNAVYKIINLYFDFNLFFWFVPMGTWFLYSLFKLEQRTNSAYINLLVLKSFLPNVFVLFTGYSLFRLFDDFDEFKKKKNNGEKHFNVEVEHEIKVLLNEKEILFKKVSLNARLLHCLANYESSDCNDPVFIFKTYIESTLRANVYIKDVFQYQIKNNTHNINNI